MSRHTSSTVVCTHETYRLVRMRDFLQYRCRCGRVTEIREPVPTPQDEWHKRGCARALGRPLEMQS